MKFKISEINWAFISLLAACFALRIPIHAVAAEKIKGLYPHEYTLNELESKWTEIQDEHEALIKNMRISTDPKIVDFLEKIALGEMTSSAQPSNEFQMQLFAVSAIASASADNAKNSLMRIMISSAAHIESSQKIRLQARAAYKLLSFKNPPLSEIMSQLDKAANMGVIYCPFADPQQGYWAGKHRVKVSLNPQQQMLLDKWLASSSELLRLEAAHCLVQAEGVDTRFGSLADEVMKKYPLNSAEYSAANRLQSTLKSIRETAQEK